mgnify:CR=1 FL=1
MTKRTQNDQNASIHCHSGSFWFILCHFDAFGRFAKLDQSEGVVTLVARLAVLGGFLGYSNSEEEIANYSKILFDFNVAPEWHTYGWMIGELPDFDACHEEWKAKHGVQGLSPPPLPQPNKVPSQQNHIWKLMNDLLKMTITEEAYEQTLKGDFKLAISCLQDKGLRYSENEKKTSQLITVAVHGPLDFGDPFQYSKVNEYQSTFGVSGFPWAVLNRKQKWDENYSAITSIADINSKVGLSIEFSIDGTSLSVKVKVKFAEDLSSSNLKYVVLLLDDGLIADQSNLTGGDYGYGTASVLKDFVHDNVLRKALTSSWLGETITSSSTKIGNVFEKSFVYEIPSVYNKNKLEIVAMAVREDKSVINARHSDIGKTQSFEEK